MNTPTRSEVCVGRDSGLSGLRGRCRVRLTTERGCIASGRYTCPGRLPMSVKLSTGAWFVRPAPGLPKKLRRVTLSFSARPGRPSGVIAGWSEQPIRRLSARHSGETVFAVASGAVHACKPSKPPLRTGTRRVGRASYTPPPNDPLHYPEAAGGTRPVRRSCDPLNQDWEEFPMCNSTYSTPVPPSNPIRHVRCIQMPCAFTAWSCRSE